MSHLALPGRDSNRATTPSNAALNITGGAIDIRIALAAFLSVSGATSRVLISKYGTAPNHSWQLYLSSGTLRFVNSDDGTNASDQACSVSCGAVGLADWLPVWTRVTYRSSDNRIQFLTAPYVQGSVPTSWAQMGTDRTATRTGIYNGNLQLSIGDRSSSGPALIGNVFRAQVWNGIEGAGGVKVFDADFSKQAPGTASFTEDASGLTVTVGTSAQPPAAAIVGRSGA